MMNTPFWKRYFAWLITGFRPRCGLCGTLMEVGTLTDPRGTEFFCPFKDNDNHRQQGDMVRRWKEKIDTLQAEIETEDRAFSSYERQQYGPIELKIKRSHR